MNHKQNLSHPVANLRKKLFHKSQIQPKRLYPNTKFSRSGDKDMDDGWVM